MCVCVSLSARVCVHSLVMLHLVTVKSHYLKKNEASDAMWSATSHVQCDSGYCQIFISGARARTVWTSVHNLHKHTSWVMTEGSHLSRPIRPKYI